MTRAAAGVQLGHAIVVLIQPHRGHEREFRRWYELDHFHVGAMAPRTFAAALFAAPPALRAQRVPRPSPMLDPIDAGSVLSAFWIEADGIDEAQRWMQAEMQRLDAAGRLFSHRDHVASYSYDFLGAATREPHGVPPALLLSQALPALACAWIERTPQTPLSALRDWLIEEHAPQALPDSGASHALVFGLRPKPDWWPRGAPEPPGVGSRALLLLALDAPPERAFAPLAAGLATGLAASGCGRLLLAAPFERRHPGAPLERETPT